MDADSEKLIIALIESLEEMVEVAGWHEDRGPVGEGWQSDELVSQIEKARDLIERAKTLHQK